MAISTPPVAQAAAHEAGKPQLRKSLKLWQIVMMGLAYLTPMTVFDTFGIVSGISNGHVPMSYLLLWPVCYLRRSAMANWCVSSRRRVRRIPTHKKPLIHTWAFWWGGHRCWTIFSCR